MRASKEKSIDYRKMTKANDAPTVHPRFCSLFMLDLCNEKKLYIKL